jgi:hypothetical protein
MTTNCERIERVRLHQPIKRLRLDKATAERLRRELSARKPRGRNKPRLITDDRQLVTRCDIASALGISVDKIKQMQAKTPNDTGLQPVRLGPKGRTVFYDIDQAERYLRVALRRRRAPDPTSGAPAAPPSPSGQAA